MKKGNKTWEERFDKDEGIQSILKLIKTVGTITGVGQGDKLGKYIKKFISQERKQWEKDLRERIEELSEIKSIGFDKNEAIWRDEVLSLLESSTIEQTEEKCICEIVDRSEIGNFIKVNQLCPIHKK